MANFAVQLKKPLAVNNDNSSCHTCMLEYRRTNGSDVEWKTLEQRPTDGAISLTALELPTTVGLSVFLPTDEHTDNQQVEFRVLAHYNGGLDVPSETIRTDLPYLGMLKFINPVFFFKLLTVVLPLDSRVVKIKLS